MPTFGFQYISALPASVTNKYDITKVSFVSGGEPVGNLKFWLKFFKKFNIETKNWYPGYGLAEATLCIATGITHWRIVHCLRSDYQLGKITAVNEPSEVT